MKIESKCAVLLIYVIVFFVFGEFAQGQTQSQDESKLELKSVLYEIPSTSAGRRL